MSEDNSKCPWFCCFLPLLGFPIFLALTIVATNVQIYPCKIINFVSDYCDRGEDNDLSLTLYYNASIANNITDYYETVSYGCRYFNVIHCNKPKCMSNVIIGNDYLCSYSSLSKSWSLNVVNNYHYDWSFSILVTLTVICLLFWCIPIFVTATYIKNRKVNKERENLL